MVSRRFFLEHTRWVTQEVLISRTLVTHALQLLNFLPHYGVFGMVE